MIIQQKTHKPATYSMLNIPTPGGGGLNIEDLDYTLPLAQSPRMLNMMYKNGVFGKRYGQEKIITDESTILTLYRYGDYLYYQTTTNIKRMNISTKEVSTVYTLASTIAGIFFVFNTKLYFMCESKYLETTKTATSFTEVVPYAPDVKINVKPNNRDSGDIIESYNRMGGRFKNSFNGDGSNTVYYLSAYPIKSVEKVVVGNATVTNYSVDTANGAITFTSAPGSGQNNVVITAVSNESGVDTDAAELRKCKYSVAYGGNNASHLFLAGNGTSKYYWSAIAGGEDTETDTVFDANYFPVENYAIVGNTEEDITGFGLQYNSLIVFKPTEVFHIGYTFSEDTNGTTRVIFTSALVNNQIGCDCPDTIRYIDNRLTWVSSTRGVCTLCSTVITDERNVMPISRNIDGGERESGLINHSGLDGCTAVDYDGKYIIFLEKTHEAYAWDYENAPYSESTKYTHDELAKATAWYLWNNMFYGNKPTLATHSAALSFDNHLYYTEDKTIYTFNNNLSDDGKAISAYYQTPMLDFNRYDYLKTIKKVYFEVRGDKPGNIKITYITDESPEGEEDPENIMVPTKLWEGFSYHKWGWLVINFAKTFARKCSIKKVTLFGILLENDELDKDLSVSAIKAEYTTVKEVK